VLVRGADSKRLMLPPVKGGASALVLLFNEFKYSSNITYAYVTSLLYYGTRIKCTCKGFSLFESHDMKSCVEYGMTLHAFKVLRSEVKSFGHTLRRISKARSIKHRGVTMFLLNPFFFITYSRSHTHPLSLVSSLTRILNVCDFSSNGPNKWPLLVYTHFAHIRPILKI
jgi:hypothetical protein